MHIQRDVKIYIRLLTQTYCGIGLLVVQLREREDRERALNQFSNSSIGGAHQWFVATMVVSMGVLAILLTFSL
jgi:hypothetical protein